MHKNLIKASPNNRYLVNGEDQPFFWLADTAWELFHRLNFDQAEIYLETRHQQGFNVVLAVALAELDGIYTPNRYGHLPLCEDDPTQPNKLYFRFIDDIIDLAAEKELLIGLLPTWGDKVTKLWGIGPEVFNHENAYIYGNFLGNRYRKSTNIIWVLGGDRPAAGYETLWVAMAEGITEGLGYKPFFTYHPWGGVSSLEHPWTGASSSEWFRESKWLDMNMWQSGHILLDTPNWEMITADYNSLPIKPVLDGEANYEGHPIDPFLRKWEYEYGRFTDYDVRKQAYRAVFAGACGHTYGHHSVWQFWSHHQNPINFPSTTWEEAILSPGAMQMIHLKNLMLSRPYLSRIPAQEMLLNLPDIPPVDNCKHYEPLRSTHPCATRCSDGTYAFVYIPKADHTVWIDLSQLNGNINASWYNPRNGSFHLDGEYTNEIISITSPHQGPDWVLVLDADLKKGDFP
jgi:hypothetical protein